MSPFQHSQKPAGAVSESERTTRPSKSRSSLVKSHFPGELVISSGHANRAVIFQYEGKKWFLKRSNLTAEMSTCLMGEMSRRGVMWLAFNGGCFTPHASWEKCPRWDCRRKVVLFVMEKLGDKMQLGLALTSTFFASKCPSWNCFQHAWPWRKFLVPPLGWS